MAYTGRDWKRLHPMEKMSGSRVFSSFGNHLRGEDTQAEGGSAQGGVSEQLLRVLTSVQHALH
jgi:hypothetical protein